MFLWLERHHQAASIALSHVLFYRSAMGRIKICGVYAIIHSASGKAYVGSSSSIRDRWSMHQSLLRRGQHHSRYLQRAWAKYGEEAFEFVELERCDADVLFDVEAAHLDRLDSANPRKGYNVQIIPGSGLGYKHTDESRRRMSEGQRKIPYDERLKFCRSFVGRKHTDETKSKMAKAATGRAFSQETRAKIGAASKGRKPSAEARAKMSEARMGRPNSPEARAKISAALKGRVITPEWRAKLSEAAKRRTVQPETRAKIAATMREVRARRRASS